jgi:hypothetical protein
MKNLLIFFAAICLYAKSNAQKVYFIYLQSEAASPFFVKMSDKVHNSSQQGYVILSMLRDSTYKISLGQPGNQKEAQFAITINKADRGFLVRNTEGQLGLLDLQTQAIFKPIPVENNLSQTSILKTDNFSKLLAQAVGDTTLLYEAIVLRQEKSNLKGSKTSVTDAPQKSGLTNQKDAEKTLLAAAVIPQVNAENVTKEIHQAETVKQENTGVINASVAHTLLPDNAVHNNPPSLPEATQESYKSIISRKSESSSTEGFGLVYLDNYNGIVDTVRLLIPNQKMTFTESSVKQAEDEKQFIETNNQETASSKTSDAVPVKEKTNCASQASETDFKKIRKIMSAKKSEDAMFEEARAYFAGKCFTTSQIKSLSTLFQSPSIKFKFFEMSYSHVSDQEDYASLQSEINDNSYTDRFKALIAK